MLELIDANHFVFGENRVQEAVSKLEGLKANHPELQIHLIGPLQKNKVKDAVRLFDYIQTVDREKLAVKLAKEMEKQMARLLYLRSTRVMSPKKQVSK